MKINKILLLIILLLIIPISVFSQDDKTVTLTVSAQGQTQDEAKQNALRNAIEQAFGTFISSNTEILNDELVKDKIVSVSSGNIQNFEVISEVQISDGGYATTLKATVSVTKLTSFVESKGVVVEFKGSILATNVKQQMLNEQNEIKSIRNIVGTCKEILDFSCDFSIVRGEPKQKNNDNNNWAVPISINVKFNKNIEQFNQYLLNSIKGIAMSKDEVSQYNQLGKKTYKIALGGDKGDKSKTKDIELLKSLAASNTNLNYKIIEKYGGKINFESDDIKKIEKMLKKLKRDRYKELKKLLGRGRAKKGMKNTKYYDIEYYDKTINPIYHFRSMSAVVSIIDLILYTKHAVLNFQITNGLDFVTPEKLKVHAKGYEFNLNSDNLTPIFNSRCNFWNFTKTYNGPNGIFGTYYGNGCIRSGKGPSFNKDKFLYEPFVNYSNKFYYNGGRDNSFYHVYNTKYWFLTQADSDLPTDIIGKNNDRSNNGFQAVISLFDFKADGNNVITFYYEDILTLADIDKVQEYKIIPISKN